MKDIINEQWPEWKTCGCIGSGSYGAVYEIQRIVDANLEQILGQEKAAVKVITHPRNDSEISELFAEGYDRESIVGTYQDKLQNIMNEYALMRDMRGSSNIVNCDDFRYAKHSDGIGFDVFFKMELLTPLLKALPEQIPESTAIRLGQDICNALCLCQKHNVVHRDIKPQNIFLSPNGDYKLGDFGIARVMARTGSATMIGTYKYMAPEVYNNKPYDARADIYSLGLVLYWMLNYRRLPFMSLSAVKLVASAEEEARVRRLSGEPIPEPACGCPALKRIVLKACAFDPEQRYRNAEEMLYDLEQLDAGSSTVIPEVIDHRANNGTADISDPAEDPSRNHRISGEQDEGTAGAWDPIVPTPSNGPRPDSHPDFSVPGPDGSAGNTSGGNWTDCGTDEGTAGIWDASIPKSGGRTGTGAGISVSRSDSRSAARDDSDVTIGIWSEKTDRTGTGTGTGTLKSSFKSTLTVPSDIGKSESSSVVRKMTPVHTGGSNVNFGKITNAPKPKPKAEERSLVAHRELSKPKSKALAVSLGVLPWTGLFGIHDFYLGNKKKGILKACTMNFVAFGWLYDIFLFIAGKYRDADGNSL